MTYKINGETASLAPYRQTWQDIPLGRDGNGITIYSGIRNCLLDFDNANPTLFNQWQKLCNTNASITSIQLLNLDATSYVTYSNAGIGLEITRPPFEAAYVNNWSILVTGISFV